MSQTDKKPSGKRIVVKVGTSTLTREGGKINLRSFDLIARVLSDVHNMGHEIILVSSGAIAVGAHKLSMEKRPETLEQKQAAASVGQCELMHLYDKFFGEYGKTVGQILLSGDDVDDEEISRNLINTFDSLLKLGVIPIVNENDSVSFAEIETHAEGHKVLGDNDKLSAVVAALCDAQLLVMFSDIDGLYDGDPKGEEKPRLIREVRVIDDDITSIAGGTGTSRGTGGMITKLQAARLTQSRGIDMIITNGSAPEKLYDIVEGKSVGTLFVGKKVAR
ncbi:MAG: glutamate 5-kinase [Oscillospiraceae bacterium]|jgi:glutamate 5-kinase|nr:glutamate 5-kinase [Oscillospiraceae bacterium]